MQLLLAEDDPVLGRALQIGLSNEGLTVDWTRLGRDAILRCERRAYAALILDLGLPDMGGFEILHRIRRSNSAIPIVVVTGRNSIEDRIRGLDFGADDYVTKPFELVELLARLRAVGRRFGQKRRTAVTAGDVTVDLRTHLVTRDCRPIPVGTIDFALLLLLLRSGEGISIAEAVRHVEVLADDVDEEAVAERIRLLQAKLGLHLVQSERGWRLFSRPTIH